MKHHVQNPWTKSPSIMLNLSVEETQQLVAALRNAGFTAGEDFDRNQADAYRQLLRTLENALSTDRPHGIKNVLP
jgi:hypothetical protein